MTETNKILNGDTLETMKTFPDNSIDTIITSPPYYQLRDYGYTEQWGLEKTYQEYLDKMILWMAECKRVIKPTGSIWVNLGDSYNTESGNMKSKNYQNTKNVCMNNGVINRDVYTKSKTLPKKSLMLIPHRFAIRCVDELGLICRNDIIWAKPNGMPESVTDRFSKKHEFIFLFVKSQKYYFDLDGVRGKHRTNENRPDGIVRNRLYEYDSKMNNPILNPKNIKGNMTKEGQTRTTAGLSLKSAQEKINPNGKNPGDVSDFWDITTKPSSEKHYATFNSDLIDKPIIAGCPEFVCNKCGKAREKIYDSKISFHSGSGKSGVKPKGKNADSQQANSGSYDIRMGQVVEKTFLGLTDCNCNAGFSGGIILDPFAGTGTTLLRALELGRQVIGIEGSKEYSEIANKRINKELIKINLF